MTPAPKIPASQAARFDAHERAVDASDYETAARLAAPPYPADATVTERRTWNYWEGEWTQLLQRWRMAQRGRRHLAAVAAAMNHNTE